MNFTVLKPVDKAFFSTFFQAGYRDRRYNRGGGRDRDDRRGGGGRDRDDRRDRDRDRSPRKIFKRSQSWNFMVLTWDKEKLTPQKGLGKRFKVENLVKDSSWLRNYSLPIKLTVELRSRAECY